MSGSSPPYTIAFHTLGCKVNHYETDAAAMRFLAAGFEEVPFGRPADVCLVNTCTVTGEADRKTRQMLRRARASSPGSLVVAMGCHVETAGAEGFADVLIGCGGRERVVELVLEALAAKSAGKIAWHQGVPQLVHPGVYEETGPVTRQSETRAYVKIQDGCDDFCAYCAIPLARGRASSRDRGHILEEVEALIQAGFLEVVITGIHIGAYGADRGEDDRSLARLIREVSAVPGLRRIRIGSLEPQTVTEGFLQELEGIPNLCRHFHLSLQSGSRTVLQRMRRRYDPERFLEIVGTLRAIFPGMGLTTDIMAGFPGETQEEHKESLAFCERAEFSRMHVFRYSMRKGTLAAEMPNPVPPAVSARRAAELALLSGRMAADFARGLDGEIREVLVENVSGLGVGAGYTPEYVSVAIQGVAAADTGSILPLRLSDNKDGTLLGRPLGVSFA